MGGKSHFEDDCNIFILDEKKWTKIPSPDYDGADLIEVDWADFTFP